MFSHYLFLDFIFYLFLEGGSQKGRETVKGDQLPLPQPHSVPLIGDLAGKPDMFPDWESNQQPFILQADVQSTEPHHQQQSLSLSNTYTAPTLFLRL